MHWICTTCGTQFAASETPPPNCPVCDDSRQYVPPSGQAWTTLEALQRSHRNSFRRLEPGLLGVGTTPEFAIGQRALFVQSPAGNVLWDCISLIDQATSDLLNGLGGLSAIAISHPHYYTTMVEWSHAFGKVPVHVHKLDAKWVMRPDAVVTFWEGDTKALPGGLTLVNTGGHFDGFQVLHWPAGAGGKGVLLSGDQPYVCPDRKWVSFMWSYPNLVPLGPAAIRRVGKSLEPFAFDRLYGAFPEQVVAADAKGAVKRSADRYLKRIVGG
jgi:hypothetical protein